jgi:hypothetical protein
VHAEQTCVAVLNQATGESRKTRLRLRPPQVVDYLATLDPIRAVYESGPTGLGLARRVPSAGELIFARVPSVAIAWQARTVRYLRTT